MFDWDVLDPGIAEEVLFGDVSELFGDEHEGIYRRLAILRCRAEVDLALVVNSAERHEVFAADGHATVAGWCRVQNRTSSAEVSGLRMLGRLLFAHPSLADAAREGRIGLPQLHLLARAHSSSRCGHLLGEYVGIFVESAGQMSYNHFRQVVERWEALNDPDGAHKDAEQVHAGRKAFVLSNGESFSVFAHGGTVDEAIVREVFERYVQAEWQTDWAAVKAVHGDASSPSLMPRTDAQRRFDALISIFRDAAAAPPGATEAEPLVYVVVDHLTFEETVEAMFGPAVTDRVLGRDHRARGDRRSRDPRHRRCETRDGIPLDPYQVVAAILVGSMRKVVFDRAGVTLNMGHKKRLFTGAAREAIMVARNRCLWPGCELPSGRCQADHTIEWSRHGPSDQDNAGPLCPRHNRWKNRGFRVWRDPDGIWHTYRPDGSEID